MGETQMRASSAVALLAGIIAAALHAQATHAGTLVVKASWSTRAGIDLRVIAPSGKRYGPKADCFRGPGSETCVINNPEAGEHKVMLEWKTVRAAGPTTVTVQVWRDGQLVGTNNVVLQQRGERRFLSASNPSAPPSSPPPPPKAPGLAVTTSWQTPADIDLVVIGPGGRKYGVEQDCLRGPGSETCVIRNPRPGGHQIAVQVTSRRGAATTRVLVEVRQSGRLTRRTTIVLGGEGDRRVLSASGEDIEPQPRAAKVLSVSASWGNRADIDLRVIGPTGAKFPPERDLLRGPGSEACVIQNITANNYGVELTYANARGLGPTRVVVQVFLDGRRIRKIEHVLERQGQRLLASTGLLGLQR